MEICYIYSIRNILNNKRYIGSSIQVLRRQRAHFQELRDNKHPNEKLQKAYNKYKKENFIFEILEEFTPLNNKERFDKEQYWMDKYLSFKKGYNCTSNAAWNGKLAIIEGDRLENMKKKVSKALKGKIPKNLEEMRKKTWRSIYELRNGIIVNEYENVKKAGEALGINYKSIHKSLKDKCIRPRKNPNLTWKYKEKEERNSE